MKKIINLLSMILIILSSGGNLFASNINDYIDFGNPIDWCNNASVKYSYELKSRLINFKGTLIAEVDITIDAIWLRSSSEVPVLGNVKNDKKFDKNRGKLIATYRNGTEVKDNTQDIDITSLREEITNIIFNGESIEVVLKKFKITNNFENSLSILSLWVYKDLPLGGVIKLEVDGKKKQAGRNEQFSLKALLVAFNDGDC